MKSQNFFLPSDIYLLTEFQKPLLNYRMKKGQQQQHIMLEGIWTKHKFEARIFQKQYDNDIWNI